MRLNRCLVGMGHHFKEIKVYLRGSFLELNNYLDFIILNGNTLSSISYILLRVIFSFISSAYVYQRIPRW